MKRITATALCLSLGLACTGLSAPAFAKHDDAARFAAIQQRQAVEAQRRAVEAQRAQMRHWGAEQRHAFADRPERWRGGLNAWQACAMFFGRC